MAKYKNWNEQLPKGWVSIDGWAMPEDVEAFFPGKEFIDSRNPVFYLHEDMWWDLKTSSYTEN